MFLFHFLPAKLTAIHPTIILRPSHLINSHLIVRGIWRSYGVMSLLAAVRKGPNFDNLALRALPVNVEGNQVRIVPDACFVRVRPTQVQLPRLVLASHEALELLELPTELIKRDSQCADAHDEFVQYLSGNKIWSGSEPSAHCYCGHQFGSFVGQLGDGAVIYLGEVVNSKDERWELQLKGAGPTPFSRSADGRKVLRSSLREFLCSEAMHHLGIPTTRAATLVTSDTWVQRDVFYTGQIILERASVTSRLAPSFIRFGSFEISKPKDPITGRQGPSADNPVIVQTLSNYVISTFYPEAMHHLGIPTTRAATLVTSDTWVQRDVFYTGQIILERASVTSRLAPSFIRFGSFEISKPKDPITGRQGPSADNPVIVQTLSNYVISTFYPEIWSKRVPNDFASLYLNFFEEVVRRTATLVALWQAVGFCHGLIVYAGDFIFAPNSFFLFYPLNDGVCSVLNTDNMSILGLTMDYGPFGFMDRFMWDHVCNASDTDGRYSYAQQPSVCAWNCARLAECLIRALGGDADQFCAPDQSNADNETGRLAARFRTVLDRSFMPTFQEVYLRQMRRKVCYECLIWD
ncbi:Selenoprotein O [Fasciola gigantica]|uniref:Selenoprotein O n=1 Tax=Fasciola gigantica TaxID=46835 RepID=A0A504YKA5_FASGI|nr:Selenoprotein O [Fasciola gigantica]